MSPKAGASGYARMSWRIWPWTSVRRMSLEEEREGGAGVVDAEEVEHGCVEIVDFDFVLDGLVSPVVGGAVGEARFDAAAGHPGG